MKARFGFLLFDQFEDMDFVGPWEMIGIWHSDFNGPEMLTIAEHPQIIKSVHQLKIQADCNFEQCPELDYLLIPGGQGTRTEVNNDKLISFVKTKAKTCKQILSVCTGSFLLQAAGLLNGKKATTHWASIDRLKKFSEVKVVEQRIVKDGNIWTSAGISAGVDLALAFIADIANEEIAAKVQLQAEYYPEHKIYRNDNQKLPAYVKQGDSSI